MVDRRNSIKFSKSAPKQCLFLFVRHSPVRKLTDLFPFRRSVLRREMAIVVQHVAIQNISINRVPVLLRDHANHLSSTSLSAGDEGLQQADPSPAALLTGYLMCMFFFLAPKLPVSRHNLIGCS